MLSLDTYVIKNLDTGYERVVNARKMRKLNKTNEDIDAHPTLSQSDFTDDEEDIITNETNENNSK